MICTVADWPSTLPAASFAVTANQGPVVLTVMVVSKPLCCWEPTLLSPPALEPASTVQLSSSVAPFQLA